MTPPTTAVLLCAHLADARLGLDLAAVARLVEGPDVTPEVVDRLCERPAAIRETAAARADRLVVGGCGRPAVLDGAEPVLRGLGIDPLGVELVDVAPVLALAPEAGEDRHLAAHLLARVARARAYAGSRPEHVIPRFVAQREPVSRRRLFTVPPVRHRPVAVLRSSRCASEVGCRECIGLCPRGAISVRGARVYLDRQRCDSCGVCVVRCPRGAIDHPRDVPAALDREIEALLAGFEPGGHPVALLFACRRNLGAVAALRSLPRRPGDAWALIDVPCTGAVSASLILRCLAAGAAAVAVARCGADCPFHQGARVDAAVDFVRAALAMSGEAPERIRLAPVEPGALAAVLTAEVRPAPPAAAALTRLTAASAVRHLARAVEPAPARLGHAASPFGVIEVGAACTLCGVCSESCPTGALQLQRESRHASLAFDPDRCTGCGACAARCPEAASGAIVAERALDLEVLRSGPSLVREDAMAACERCGAGIATASALRAIERRIDGSANAAVLEMITRRCPQCRGM
jgi:ferredoxin